MSYSDKGEVTREYYRKQGEQREDTCSGGNENYVPVAPPTEEINMSVSRNNGSGAEPNG